MDATAKETASETRHLSKRISQSSNLEQIPQPSLQKIAQLPIHERHLLLAQQVANTAEDFVNDPSLTEFSEIDMGDWGADDGGA